MSESNGDDERFRKRREEMTALHLARAGLVRVGHMPIRDVFTLMKETLPTLAHAARYFDAATNALGTAAVVDAQSTFGRRALFVRDVEDWLVPVPAVELYVGRSKHVTMILAGPPPRPPEHFDVLPRGELATTGELWIHEGEAHHVIRYDERGVWKESTTTVGDSFTFAVRQKEEPFTIDPLARPPTPEPIAMLCAPELEACRGDVERLAWLVAPQSVRARVAARALLSVPIPGGADFTWAVAHVPMHTALVEERVPADAAWLVCDGFNGAAIAWGGDLDDAMSRWRDEVFRKKPKPPVPDAPTESGPSVEQLEPGSEHRDDDAGTHTLGLGTFRMSVPSLPQTIAWPPATPRNVPAVAVPLPALPHVPEQAVRAGFTRWVRLLGKNGHVVHALRRDEPDGSTWIGEHALELVDPEMIADEMAAAEAVHYDGYPADVDPRRDANVVYFVQRFRVWDDLRRERTPPRVSSGSGGAVVPLNTLADDRVAWEVARIRRLR